MLKRIKKIKEIKMIKGLVITMLAIETVSDIRKHTVSGIRIIAFMVVGIVLNCVMKYQSIWSVVGGIVVGLTLFGYSLITKGGIGFGDGLVFICLGIFLGLSQNLRLLFFSLLAAAVFGGIYALIKKKSIKAQIPFMPCILGTYIMMVFMEVLI